MTRSLLRLLPLALLVLSCSKAANTKAPKEAAATAQPPPAELVGVATISPEGLARLDQLAGTFGMSGAVTPAALTGALASMVEAKSLDGVDAAKPIRLLIVDPKRFPKPLVVLAAVADAAKLEKSAAGVKMKSEGGHAVVGNAAAVDLIAGWALSTLAKAPAPAAPTLTFYPGALLKSYRSEIETTRRMLNAGFAGQGSGAAVGKILDAEVSGFLALAEQSDRVEVALDVVGQGLFLELALVPRPNTPFAAFCRAQKPSDYTLVAKLPASKAGALMAGSLDLGPFREAMVNLTLHAAGPLFGEELAEKAREHVPAIMALMTGEVAMVGGADADGRFKMSELVAVSDGAKAMDHVRGLLGGVAQGKTKSIDMMGMRLGVSANLQAGNHAGVQLASYTMTVDTPDLPPEQREMMRRMYGGDGLTAMVAGFDQLMAITAGPDGAPEMTRTIDAARTGKDGYQPSPATQAALDESRRRKESFVVVFDPAAMAGAATAPVSTVAIGGGFADGSARIRIGVPAAAIGQLVSGMILGGGM